MDNGLLLGVPWTTDSSWNEANHTLDSLIAFHHEGLDRTMDFGEILQALLSSLFSLLEELCITTCPRCEDPCCLSAGAWFDFRDLLFIHLRGLEIPPAQLKSGAETPCHYLGAGGCTLERICRPWICTWYLCATQLAALRKNGGVGKDFYDERVLQIRRTRNEMERAFIAAVC